MTFCNLNKKAPIFVGAFLCVYKNFKKLLVKLHQIGLDEVV